MARAFDKQKKPGSCLFILWFVGACVMCYDCRASSSGQNLHGCSDTPQHTRNCTTDETFSDAKMLACKITTLNYTKFKRVQIVKSCCAIAFNCHYRLCDTVPDAVCKTTVCQGDYCNMDHFRAKLFPVPTAATTRQPTFKTARSVASAPGQRAAHALLLSIVYSVRMWCAA